MPQTGGHVLIRTVTPRKLPAMVAAVFTTEAERAQVLHCVPADLDTRARYQDGYLVITPQQVITIVGPRIVLQQSRLPGDQFVAHVMAGSGMFLVTGKAVGS